MPYIIETSEPRTVHDSPAAIQQVVFSRRAVATLQDAASTVADLLNVAYAGSEPEVDVVIGEPGGTIGPLPDGTTIEVRPVADWQLRAMIPACNTSPPTLHVNGADLIDAFNEAQTVPA